jgi:hypothetical protein
VRYELNIYTLFRKKERNPTQRLRYNWATLFLGGRKYGDMAFQVVKVSNERVKYGHEF